MLRNAASDEELRPPWTEKFLPIRAALWLLRTVRRGTEEALGELQAILTGVEDRLTNEEYQELSRYLLETGELSVEELNGKIELMIHQRRIREGLLTTAEQLIRKGLEEGEEIGIRKGMEQGEEAGRREERRALITSMIARGMGVDEIAEVTGLSVEDVRAPANNNNEAVR
jgi:predicted transposase/invertase (TIGR01784 family)